MTSPPPRARRLFSCLGCLVAGPLGCLSFLFGAVTVALLLLPQFAESYVAENLPDYLDRELAGEFSVDDVQLAWTGPQELDGIVVRDDDGRVVLRASLVLPPMVALLGEGDLGRTSLRLEGDLAFDREGRSNLERAFELLDESGEGPRGSLDGDLLDLFEFLMERRGEVLVEVRRLGWSIEREEGTFRATLTDGRALYRMGDGGTAFLDFVADLAAAAPGETGEGRPGSINVEAHLHPEAFGATGEAERPGVWGSLTASGVPTELLELFDLLDADTRHSLGNELDLRVAISESEGTEAPFRLSLGGEGVEGTATGTLRSRGLFEVGRFPAGSETIDFDASLLGSSAASLAGRLPVDVGLERLPSTLALRWTSDQPLLVAAESFEWREWGRPDARGVLDLRLPDGVLVFAEGRELPFREATLALERRAEEPWRFSAEGALGAGGDGRFAFRHGVPPVSPDEAGAGATVTLSLSDLPVAELDAGLALGGRLAETLGAFAEARLEVAGGSDELRSFSLVVLSELADADFTGEIHGQPSGLDEWLAALDVRGSLEGAGRGWPVPLASSASTFEWSGPVEFEYQGWRERATSDGEELLAVPVYLGPLGLESFRPKRRGSLALFVPEIVYAHSDEEHGSLELLLTNVDLLARGDSEVLRIDLTCGLEEGGALQQNWTLYGLTGPFGRDGHEDLRLRAQARGLESAYLDLRLGTRGLVTGVFGERVDVVFEGGGLTAGGGRIQGELRSNRAVATVAGFQQDGTVLTDTAAELTLSLEDEDFDRLVRPLLPFVAALHTRTGEPLAARFVLAGGTLPLDGDLDVLAGELELEVHGARVEFPERFESFLLAPPEGAEPRDDVAVTTPARFLLDRGRVECTAVELPVRGRPTLFEGEYGLGGTDLDLQIELPLEIVGANVNLLLHNLRDKFRPDLGVPIEISGDDVASLDMSVRPQWMRTVNDVLGTLVPEPLVDTVREIFTDEEPESPSDREDSR